MWNNVNLSTSCSEILLLIPTLQQVTTISPAVRVSSNKNLMTTAGCLVDNLKNPVSQYGSISGFPMLWIMDELLIMKCPFLSLSKRNLSVLVAWCTKNAGSAWVTNPTSVKQGECSLSTAAAYRARAKDENGIYCRWKKLSNVPQTLGLPTHCRVLGNCKVSL